MEKLVTFAVPVYNTQKYLDRCIESLVNQTYKNLEIILVDDGSTDNSFEVCKKWEQTDDRIKVIRKENGGAGMARNTAVDNSHGDYIFFVDSDDYYALDSVEKCVSLAEKESLEMIAFGFNLVDKDGKIKKTIAPKETAIFRNEEVREFFIPGMLGNNPKTGEPLGTFMSLCACISMDLLRRTGWRCVSEREVLSEDLYSLLVLFRDMQAAAVVKDAFYYYCDNSQSLSRTYERNRLERNKLLYNQVIKLCDELNYSEVIKHMVTIPFMNITIGNMKQITVTDYAFKEKYALLKEIIADNLIQEVLENTKHDKMPRNRKILSELMRKRMYLLCYILCRIKS